MMNILHISDIHGSIDAVKRLMIEIGKFNVDLITVGGDIEDGETIKVLGELGKPLYVVLGNMDYPGLRHEIRDYLLEGRVVNVGGISIMGYPPPANYRDLVHAVSGVLILLSHYPPYGTKVDLAFGGRHIGSKDVLRLVNEVKPKLVLCGHVHEARGVDMTNNTTIVNPGPLYQGYYSLVHIEDDEVDAKLMKL